MPTFAFGCCAFAKIQSLSDNQCGNITVITGLVLLPMIAIAGVAIDCGRISRTNVQLQQSADSAVLAAASAKNLPSSEAGAKDARRNIASKYLSNSISKLTDVESVDTPVISVSNGDIEITLKARVTGSFASLFAASEDAEIGSGTGGSAAGTGRKGYNVTVGSKAGWKSAKNYICMMALNPAVSSALTVSGTADIIATNCSIQVNSSSKGALSVSGAATIKAGSVCVSGNYSGSNISPVPKTSCASIADPLASQFASDYNAAYAASNVRYTSKSRLTLPTGITTLQPGIYESGIRVDKNAILNLQPGIYFIKDGTLEIKSGGILNGTGGVTIVFTGSELAYLSVQAQGSLNIKAPASGSFAGIAVAQHPAVSAKNTNRVIGGGQLNVEGIIYMPKQAFYVTGNGSGTVTNFSTSASQFAIVADTITIQGNGQVNVGQSADYSFAGLPALPSTNSAGGSVSLLR